MSENAGQRHRNLTGVRALMAAAAMAVLPVGAQASDIYGLVVGVDDYDHVGKLKGAINDANDIAAALKAAGAREVKVLRDKEASRDNLLAAWAEMTSKAKQGDTFIFTFAGHGSQSPERVKGSETDGMDEFLVLPEFDFQGAATRERLVDDELSELLKSASHLQVVFVIDSCTSGTMTRAYAKPTQLTVRAVPGGPIKDDALPMPSRATEATADDMPHVVSLSAVPDGELDPEILIEDKPRGALSFAVARAFEGFGDLNGDRVLGKEELEAFVSEVVRMAVDGQQHPQIAPAGHRDLQIPINTANPALQEAAKADPIPAEKTAAALPSVRLAIINAGVDGPEALMGRLEGAAPSQTGEPAQLTWDVMRREVTNQFGDVVAYGPGGGSETRAFARVNKGAAPAVSVADDLPWVQNVVDKTILVELLKEVARPHALAMSLEPDDKLHVEGTELAFGIQGHKYTFLTLINLAADGTLNFLYPLDDGTIRDPLQIPPNKPYRLDVSAQAPFGADHLVALISAEPLTELHGGLRELDGKPVNREVAKLLGEHMRDREAQIGVLASFTVPKP